MGISHFHEFGILSRIYILAPYQIDILKGCGFFNGNIILIWYWFFLPTYDDFVRWKQHLFDISFFTSLCQGIDNFCSYAFVNIRHDGKPMMAFDGHRRTTDEFQSFSTLPRRKISDWVLIGWMPLPVASVIWLVPDWLNAFTCGQCHLTCSWLGWMPLPVASVTWFVPDWVDCLYLWARCLPSAVRINTYFPILVYIDT